jgi:hypothetical protein
MSLESAKRVEAAKVQNDLVTTDKKFLVAAARVQQRFAEVRARYAAGELSERDAKSAMSGLRAILKKVHHARREFLVAHHALVDGMVKHDFILAIGCDSASPRARIEPA